MDGDVPGLNIGIVPAEPTVGSGPPTGLDDLTQKTLHYIRQAKSENAQRAYKADWWHYTT
ncbi:hypothetical protein VH569_33760 [Azospirillum sp. 11R-A]|uniref:hypothetical protein n=1 Tax=Azospirillum sp. 11R-A TaxID=3111634 RepID=UPI003C26EFF4